MKKFNFNQFVADYSDVVVPILLVSVLGMIIVPLPTWLLDILLAVNLSLGIVILLVAMSVSDSLKLATFPTILLITTLFRLALNISSTRLILSQGDAGDVIEAFGNFVTGGSMLVGMVLFLIITLVNFLVIAKGAERVSEVAARFTLDAMPGKQMSIDADLRAGTITMDQAQERRTRLQRESQMYGAMDGAMKFVKGDAIAGIVITVINVIFGAIIGVVNKGWSIERAMSTYSKLSVGDGIVSMLPSFVISIAAGIVTTRVASDKKDANLGNEMMSQLSNYPKVFLIAAGMLFAFGAVPGLPTLPFWILAGMSGGYGYMKTRTRQEKVQQAIDEPKEKKVKKALEKHGDQMPFILPSPISLEVGSAIIPFVDDSQDEGRFINELIPLLRHGLYYELGVNFPGIQVRGQTTDMEPEGYVININEVPVARGKIKRGCILIGESSEQLKLFNIQGQESIHPIDGSIVSWVPEEFREVCVQAGFRMWDVSEYLILHLSYVLRKHAHEFLGLQEVQTLLTELEKSHPALVKELVPKVITVLQLSEIFQRLVQEEIAIRDLKNIFSTLAQWAEVERNTLVLTEHIRAGLKRYVTHKYAGHGNSLAVYLLDRRIEEMIQDAIRTTEKGNYLALDPEITQELIESVGKEIASHPFPPGAKPPVILTTQEVRRYFRKIVELEFPQLSVLSYQELNENLRIQPIARINLARLQSGQAA